MQALWHLENIDVTHILCPNKLGDADRMAKHTHRSYAKGEAFFVPDDLSDRIFFINEGRVKISSMNEEGKEITKAILGKGEVFGELALVGEARRRDWAAALENTEVCVVTLNELRDLMRERSDLNLFFMKIFGSRQLEMERRLESLVFRDSRSRIIEFLVELTQNKGQRVGFEWVIRKPITHQEIAADLNSSREVISRLLKKLESQNRIELFRNGIRKKNF